MQVLDGAVVVEVVDDVITEVLLLLLVVVLTVVPLLVVIIDVVVAALEVELVLVEPVPVLNDPEAKNTPRPLVPT